MVKEVSHGIGVEAVDHWKFSFRPVPPTITIAKPLPVLAPESLSSPKKIIVTLLENKMIIMREWDSLINSPWKETTTHLYLWTSFAKIKINIKSSARKNMNKNMILCLLWPNVVATTLGAHKICFHEGRGGAIKSKHEPLPFCYLLPPPSLTQF